MKRFIADAREIGLVGVFAYYLSFVLRRIGVGEAYHYYLTSVDMVRLLDTLPDSLPALTEVEPHNATGMNLDVAADIIDARFAQGSKLFALQNKVGTAKAWIWGCERRFSEDEVRATFTIPANAVWDFGVFVVPSARFGRSFMKLWAAFARHWTQRDKRYSISRIASHNIGSVRAHKALPHKLLGSCLFIRIKDVQFSFSTLKPFIAVTSPRHPIPIFKFNEAQLG